MLTMAEKETCNMLEGLFKTLCNKLKTQYNEDHKVITFQETI